MSGTKFDRLRKILTFAAVVEIATGVALMVVPAIVVRLLVGEGEIGERLLLGRLAGIALFALGVACWPSQQRSESSFPALRAIFIYNVLIALFLAYLFVVDHIGGVLLWPGVALHAAVAFMLVVTWRDNRRAEPAAL